MAETSNSMKRIVTETRFTKEVIVKKRKLEEFKWVVDDFFKING